ncbi:OOP family OmpA-OmpF porin [Kluyvera sp. 1366]
MKKFNASVIAVMVAGGLFSVAHAAVDIEKVYGAQYQPVARVANSQAQIVYYRDKATDIKEAAHIYVDGEYHSALLPGMFTTFCVTPGNHSLGGFIEDAPLYKGKEEQPYRDNLEAGKTYFVKYDAEANGRPLQVNPQQASRELANLKAQMHTLSRASKVEECRYIGAQHADYTLSSDVLFAFGKSGRGDITGQGREAISELISKLRTDGVQANRIQVIGHTDPIGKAAGNLRLGQQRANTVRRLLIEAGLPARNLSASSAGSDELLINTCSGSRAEQIECNAPNRRVVVRVQQ